MSLQEIRNLLNELLVFSEKEVVSSDILRKHIAIAINELRNFEEHLQDVVNSMIDR